jgi:hypothetical protein
MFSKSRNHPVRRIREAFKNASGDSGLREFHTSAGFAAFIGRSPSSIRSAESGQMKKWDRLAEQIEEVTGVAASWMLSDPIPSEPIMGTDGKPWSPEEHLDFLGGACGIDWRLLVKLSPQSAVNFANRLVEKKLTEDLLGSPKTPSTSFLKDLSKLLEEHGCLTRGDLDDLLPAAMIGKTEKIISDLVQMVTPSRASK